MRCDVELCFVCVCVGGNQWGILESEEWFGRLGWGWWREECDFECDRGLFGEVVRMCVFVCVLRVLREIKGGVFVLDGGWLESLVVGEGSWDSLFSQTNLLVLIALRETSKLAYRETMLRIDLGTHKIDNCCKWC